MDMTTMFFKKFRCLFQNNELKWFVATMCCEKGIATETRNQRGSPNYVSRNTNKPLAEKQAFHSRYLFRFHECGMRGDNQHPFFEFVLWRATCLLDPWLRCRIASCSWKLLEMHSFGKSSAFHSWFKPVLNWTFSRLAFSQGVRHITNSYGT